MCKQRIQKWGAICLVALGLLVLAMGTAPPATAFSGALSSADFSILGTGNWIVTGPTQIEWSVFQNPDASWHYAYTFSHPGGETSHFILETSTNFTTADFLDPSGDYAEAEIGWHDQGSGNPNMPSSIYGIKFDEAWGLTSLFEFDSFRMPVWGDFYSKNGSAGGYGVNSAWNQGFGMADTDPDAPAMDGSIENHILVPDTQLVPIPEPSSLLLVGASLIGAFVARRRFR